MIDWFLHLSPVSQTLWATMFTYMVTMLGASLVFFFRTVNQKIMDVMMGFAAGVMIAASYWSLLSPAIELSEELGHNPVLFVALGFLFGGAFIMLSDIILTGRACCKEKGDGWRRCALVATAVTMHNIPEGLAVGLALSLAFTFPTDTYILSAMSLAIAIGIQNIPEGAAVSIPMLEDGNSKPKAFLYGFFSGLVEPISALITLLLARFIPLEIMPWLLAFAAGAMIFVTVEELIPDIKSSEDYHFGMWAFIAGFLIMMTLELVL